MGNESRHGWTAGAAVYSGRRDPTWEIKAAVAARLVRHWKSLPAASQEPGPAPPLGYRGCFLRDPDGQEWRAFRGIAVMGRDARRDADHAFERAILSTAPTGLLPPHVSD